MSEQRVKRTARDFAALVQIEIRIVGLNVRETGIPIGFLGAAKLLALDFGNEFRCNVRKFRAGREFR